MKIILRQILYAVGVYAFDLGSVNLGLTGSGGIDWRQIVCTVQTNACII